MLRTGSQICAVSADLSNGTSTGVRGLHTAETDALCAEGSCLLCILGGICVRADAERLVLIGKLHDAAEVTAVGVCGNGGDERIVDLTGGAVEGERVTFLEDFAGEGIGVPALII